MVRNYLLTIFFGLIFFCNASAQEQRERTISGSVQDADLREPLVQATIQLFRSKDSTFVGGTMTDIRGNFSLDAPSNGIYRLKISSVGFKQIQREVTMQNNRNQDLGELFLEPEAVMLKEAVVTGRAAQIVVRKDTLVYNPEAFRTPEGSPIEELIRRMPGAEVDKDGNVNYQHSRNKLQPNANLDTWRFSYGGQLMLRLPQGIEISTNLHENCRRGYNDPSSNTNELIWNGQVSKSFLKSKTLIVALNFYDLLHQQSNYDSWVNANGRGETHYNSINSYAMLHVRYRLNMFGGKVDTEGRYDKKWGNRR